MTTVSATAIRCPECGRTIAELCGNTFVIKEKGRIVRFIGQGTTTCPHVVLVERRANGQMVYDRCAGVVRLGVPESV